MSCTPPPPGPCRPRSVPRLDSLAVIVDHYVAHRRPCGKLAFYQQQPSLERALDAVASWRGADGKVLAHQRRLSRASKAGAGERIQRLRLDGVGGFDEIFERVQQAIGSVRGIGDLAVYDVALHVGAFLGKLPERVYLQAGARRGARALGLGAGQRALPVDAFPAELRRLEAWEVEDVLCIYKAELAALARRMAA